MNTVLFPGENLPAGLLLPLPEEDTTQYLTENFVRPTLTPEDIIDYGTFVVALAAWEAPVTGRVSLMPTEQDFRDMHDAGYGLGVRTISKHGGLRKLQSDLGFCPDGQDLSEEVLLERLSWLANYAYVGQHGDSALEEITIEELIKWGAVRDLIPGSNRTRAILNGDTLTARRMLGMEKKVTTGAISAMDIYRFGQKVLDEHGKPLGSRELSQFYADEFPSDPYELIRWKFDTLTKFWMAFDLVPTTSGFKKKDLINMGVQRHIRHGHTMLTPGLIAELSRNKQFASKQPLVNHFDSIPNYRTAVDTEYEKYLELVDRLEESGVPKNVTRAVCLRTFDGTNEHNSWLQEHQETLSLLSSPDATYILQVIERGFDLGDAEILDMQLGDVLRLMNKIGIKDIKEINFVLGLIPRFDIKEAGVIE